MNHCQVGDPAKLGRAVVALVSSAAPPVRLVAGSDAHAVAAARADRLREGLQEWHALSMSTDFDE
jgi:alkanesulfonate monooxygenase SsuD/methylene tetrahydromethanopterin reductase-like flavin-dependent oxidoreductase (luciferase family)